MDIISLAISVCSLLAAIASAIAAWKSAASAKASNILAQEALTKRAHSELFLKVFLELGRIHRLMDGFINDIPSDAEFILVFDGQAAAALLPLLKELEALSPEFRDSLKQDASLSDLLKRVSSKGYSPSKEDLILMQRMIDILQNSQRKELNRP